MVNPVCKHDFALYISKIVMFSGVIKTSTSLTREGGARAARQGERQGGRHVRHGALMALIDPDLEIEESIIDAVIVPAIKPYHPL
jgi:hypothetical protein